MKVNQLIVKCFLFSMFMLFIQNSFAQKSDDILGVWLTGNKRAHVQIYKVGVKYFGKIVWLIEPNENGKPRMDVNNPETKKRTQPLMGLVNLNNFVFDEDEWEDGTIYDPKNGKTYSCVITLGENKTLNVRGYVGISLMGRTDVWQRVK
jgi:uncharacterized protein (DUF2147 family)